MKFSSNWIREFVEGLDLPAAALERLITMKTAECEGVETVGALLAEATQARVLSVEPIAGGHNVKAVVDAGRYGTRTVVCGAPNCRPGITTVYVPLGVKVVSGIESDGMLASGAELELSRDHSGILELKDGDELPLTDSVIEIDNKSITHRPDLWGHHGMAREVAAIADKPLRDPVRLDLLPPPGGPVQVEIEDLTLCPRFSALVFENVRVMPSPLWLQFRLMAIGLNSINNIVDLTNYLMAELAQPTHAYDRARLSGETLWARPARPGESIVGLNDETYELAPSNLVIADGAGPVGIAGVIGGRDSSISESTTSIVFEAANFHAASVRRTSVALKVRTDASMRFEKAQDPHNTVRALARALELLPILSPGIRLVGGLADRKREMMEPESVELDLDWLSHKLGHSIEPGEVRRILTGLEFKVTPKSQRVFSVRIPSWRATKDVAMAEDLVEEVGRMIGYDSIQPQPPFVPCAPSYDPPEREFLRGVKRMVAAQGYSEVSNYSFVSEEEARRFGFSLDDHVRVLNPIAAGQELLRTSLLPGVYRNIVENAKYFERFRLFEVGHEIHRGEGEPAEIPHLMAAAFSRDGDGRDGLFELKRLAAALAPGVRTQAAKDPGEWEHSARCAELWWNGKAIGRLSEISPKLIEEGRGAVLDLDLMLLQELAAPAKTYRPVRRFPSSAFDLSVIAEARRAAADLELEIRRFAGEMAESVEYVREYQGEPLAAGQKSVSFRVVVSAPDRTLSSAEVTGLRDRVIEGLRSLGFELRV